MRSHTNRPNALPARSWFALALLLTAAVAGAADPGGAEPASRAAESIAGAVRPQDYPDLRSSGTALDQSSTPGLFS